jgi:23S rRNA pseudouridine955/2504/2580 synthase/23S rRNA pseudouridine1911/1915/1917 synthase
VKNQPDILYADDHLIAVAKPAGITVIPDRWNPTTGTLRSQVESKFGRVFVLHRLDRNTSGVVLFARNATTHRTLSIHFEERKIRKTYQAIVEGCPATNEGTIDTPIIFKKGKASISSEGKESITLYRILERFQGYSLISLQPITGRTHQIRIHCQASGFPLIVDPLYSERSEIYTSEIKGARFKSGKYHTQRPLINRTSLHAEKITCIHPHTNKELSIEAPLPKDIKACINQLRKWRSIDLK